MQPPRLYKVLSQFSPAQKRRAEELLGLYPDLLQGFLENATLKHDAFKKLRPSTADLERILESERSVYRQLQQ
jgi:hypothetical protein